jgi:hypothetical protein
MPVLHDREGPLRQRLGAVPVPPLDRHDGALCQSHGGRGPRSDVQPDVHGVRQDRIGAFGLAVEQPRDALQGERRRRPPTPGRHEAPGDFGVVPHLAHALAAQEGTQHRPPALDRGTVRDRSLDRHPFGSRGPPFGCGRLARERPHHGAEDRDRRIALDRSPVVEPLQPPRHRFETAGGIHGLQVGGDQSSDLVGVAGGLCVVDGHLRQAVGLAPGGGAGMELGDDVALTVVELGPKHLLEQPVVAVPLTASVERDQQ